MNLTGDTIGGLFVASLILGNGASLNLKGAQLLVNALIDNGGSYINGDVMIVPAAVPLPPAWLLLASVFLPGACWGNSRRRHA